MYGSILIAIDDTPAGRHAMEQALVLARSEESRVVITAVVPGYDGDLRLMGDKNVLKPLENKYAEVLAEAGQTARAMGVEAKTVLSEGDPVEEVLALAERNGADLICAGKQGSYYSDVIPIGSVAAKLARLAECDVLLTPPEKTLGLDNIAALVDGSRPSLRAAARAQKIALRYGGALTLATAYEINLEAYALSPSSSNVLHARAADLQQPFLEAARAMGIHSVTGKILMGMPVYQSLLDMLRKLAPGLVVMGTAGRGGFQRLLLGSVAERIIASGEAPVLLARKEAQNA